MEVHLVDGTYELFRHHFAVPSHVAGDGVEVAATRAVLGSLLRMLEGGATHVGVATDHVVESFRNDLFDGYKTGEATPPELFAQFALLEGVLAAAGFAVFAMVEHEADDALGAAAVKAAEDPRVERVLVCTPDKDLAQVVDDGLRIVQYPDDPDDWAVQVRGAARLADALVEGRADAELFRRLATLDLEAPVMGGVDDLRWAGPREGFAVACRRIDAPRLAERAERLAERRR